MILWSMYYVVIKIYWLLVTLLKDIWYLTTFNLFFSKGWYNNIVYKWIGTKNHNAILILVKQDKCQTPFQFFL